LGHVLGIVGNPSMTRPKVCLGAIDFCEKFIIENSIKKKKSKK
jgi:hypothetical protein